MSVVEYYLTDLLTEEAAHLSWVGAERQRELNERARAGRAAPLCDCGVMPRPRVGARRSGQRRIRASVAALNAA